MLFDVASPRLSPFLNVDALLVGLTSYGRPALGRQIGQGTVEMNAASRNAPRVDSVRASRDGHEFHENWAARKAMQLLQSHNRLAGIAVEGLHPAEQVGAPSEAVDVADLVLYYGEQPTFLESTQTSVVQVKYSISRADADFRASAAKKTIAKFAETFRHYRRKYGVKRVEDRLAFLLITNQPVYSHLEEAIRGIAEGTPLGGEAHKQGQQFAAASGLQGGQLAAFAAKCSVVGRLSPLSVGKDRLAELMIDWSAGSDVMANARLGRLKQMVRDKAGHAGTDRNVITKPDVLSALEILDEDELLPCAPALVPVEKVVPREQLEELGGLLSSLSKPMLLHAAGGMGKTVFLESLARGVQDRFETVFFDCFGGGAYRSPADARHLPRRGLLHIANVLAARGMCDPILPGRSEVDALLRTFEKRLIQAAKTISRETPGRGLLVIVDAIDNAILQGRDTAQPAFPELLLGSLRGRTLPGVKIVFSCRSHRRPQDASEYDEFELLPFTHNETAAFLQARRNRVADSEIGVAQARSGGNPRILQYLVDGGEQGVFDISEIDRRDDVDDLIEGRIAHALSSAISENYEQGGVDAFLAGLAVLPPPVPVDEYASALGVEASEVESFASDLWPLLERTNQGLLFRDEPTETLVREKFQDATDTLKRVADRLESQQAASAYAARALPSLLQKLGDGKRLFDLAFDARVPQNITSPIGIRSIQSARLKAAALYSAREGDLDRLTELLVGLSTVAAVDERGAAYIADNPDLVVAATDADALRRLFETRVGWPGSRHARLLVANTLAGDIDEALRHARSVNEWIGHYLRTASDGTKADDSPDALDAAAVPFLLISQHADHKAAAFMRTWKSWFSFEVCEHVVGLSVLAKRLGGLPPEPFDGFYRALKGEVGSLAALLAFGRLKPAHRVEVVETLARACRRNSRLDLRASLVYGPTRRLEDGLRKAAAVAIAMGRPKDALSISLRAPHRRPDLWSFRRNAHDEQVFPFIFRQALIAAANDRSIHERDVLPSELVALCSRIPRRISGAEFHARADKKLSSAKRVHRDSDKTKPLSYEKIQDAERFLGSRLEPLLDLTRALSRLLAAPPDTVDLKFNGLLKTWKTTSQSRSPYSPQGFDRLFSRLGFECATFALWARDGIRSRSVRRFLDMARTQNASPASHIGLVSVVATRLRGAALAGEQAAHARSLVEKEVDVVERVSLLAALGRAMIPASTEEAAAHFRAGLEQMDAIGAGDYEFTNALLLFASSISTSELDPEDVHTLTNICELNLGEEADRFPWDMFARALSRTAGVRGLAKLSRWDDRDRVSLNYTLLPYLAALVNDGKLDPVEAVALNGLASPVELYSCGTDEFAKAVYRQGAGPEAITQLASQFLDDNSGTWVPSAADSLVTLLRKSHGGNPKSAADLVRMRRLSVRASEERDKGHAATSTPGRPWEEQSKKEEFDARQKVTTLAADTRSLEGDALEKAIEAVVDLPHPYNRASELLAKIRAGVSFTARTEYVRLVSALPNLNLQAKLTELKACQTAWGGSSASLGPVFATLAVPLLNTHADQLLSFGGLSRAKLTELSGLTGVSVPSLAVQLTMIYAGPSEEVSGAVWLSLASLICPEASPDRGQAALRRLLRTDAAKLADTVQDGPWGPELAPAEESERVLAGMIWRLLGSPHAERRWRGAHVLRCLAQFERWDLISAVVSLASEDQAGPHQARELVFYFLHARLWLLIALSRLAPDFPRQVAAYKDFLLQYVTEVKTPHVVMRHFAARALLGCIEQKALSLPASLESRLTCIDESPYPRVKNGIKQNGGVHAARPKSAQKPRVRVNLDYDFENHDVDSLSRVFGKPTSELSDRLSEIMHSMDPDLESMHEAGGREPPYRDEGWGMKPYYHTYGQQLGWHALFYVAAELLRDAPVTDESWLDNPWEEWLSDYVLTRPDGRWLSDGVDRRPAPAFINLMERDDGRPGITGDREKILGLVWATDSAIRKLAVSGSWKSPDGISVRISSALVAPSKSSRLAKQLIAEKPFSVWLPRVEQGSDGAEYSGHHAKEGFEPLVVFPRTELGIDEHDQLASSVANERRTIAARFATKLSLTPADPFGRTWVTPRRKIGLRAVAWGRTNPRPHQEDPENGTVLVASEWLLRELLASAKRHLLLLIHLQRYERGEAHRDGRFSHTVAVVNLHADLNLKYLAGRVDHLHERRK